MSAPPRPLVLFDMDDTLVRKNTAGMYFREQYRQGRIQRRQLVQMACALAAYRLDVIDMAALARDAALQIAGEVEAEVHELCVRIYNREVRGHICPAARAALEDHRRNGACCVIITASTPYIARLLAADLGVEHLLATTLEVEAGRFTGRLVGEPCFGQGKVTRATAFAQQHGLSLHDAWFYTDSHSDAPLLERVGHPRVVRPDPRLRLLAWWRNWPVLPW